MNLEDIFTIDTLCEAFYKCAKVSYWKESTQRFKDNLLLNVVELREELLNGTYKVSPTIDFDLYERGKIRHINAPVIRDRVVQKVLMEKVLLPVLTKPLIYDNYASLKNKGTSLARKRMGVHLHKFMQKHGTNGYILQIDIRKYFESIDHEVLKKLYRKEVHESDEIMSLIDYMIDTASPQRKGLNLGSECPQIFAVYYLHTLDTFIKVVKGEHYYGRYMDDAYVISDSKEHLKQLLAEVRNILADLKLELNEKKTHITSIKHGFTYLQIKYSLQNGKAIKRITHDKVVRERRRLKGFRRLVDKGRMSKEKAWLCYRAWRQSAIKDSNACYKTIKNMDAMFDSLFQNVIRENRKPHNKAVREIFRNISIEESEVLKKWI